MPAYNGTGVSARIPECFKTVADWKATIPELARQQDR